MEVKAKTRSPLVAVVLLATLLAGAACDRRGVGAWVAPAGRSHASGERPRVEVLVYRAQGCGYDSSDYRADRVAVGTRRVLTAALRRLLHRLRRPGDPSEFVQSACVDGLGVLTRAEWEHGARDS